MTFWKYLHHHHQQLFTDACRHVVLVVPCVVVATVLGVLIGIATHRSEWAGRLATTSAAAFLTMPALAVLGLLIPFVGLGVRPAVITLTLCGLLPVVRNCVAGLRGVDPAPAEADRGVGGSRVARLVRLLRVQLPLAWPPILGGIRASTQLSMGLAALAAYASGPGLGKEIFRGLSAPGDREALDEVLAGTLGIMMLALLFDVAYVVVGRLTVSGQAKAGAP